MSESRSSKRVVVRGRVQGVGFRFATRAEAERLGVNGWVRNRADGSVEAELRGTEQQIEQMLDWLKRGPDDAMVTSLEVSEARATRVGLLPAPRGFRITQ